ncbi:MAG TPA: SufD family Fe-S cluster assembly protein [Steroidobacteraceae bacterium]
MNSAATIERILGDYEHQGGARSAVAARALLEKGLPAVRDERWRHANLRVLDQIPNFAPHATVQALPAKLPPLAPGFLRLLIRDGRRSTVGSDGDALKATRVAPAAAPLNPSHETHLSVLGDLFANESTVIEVREHLALEVILLGDGGASYPQLDIKLAPGARVELIERQLSSAPSFLCPRIGVTLGDGATLNHYRLQKCERGTVLFETLTAILGAGSRYDVRQVGLGSGTARTSALLQLKGRDAQLRWTALATGSGEQRADTLLRTEHHAPGTRTEELFRGLAAGQSRISFSADAYVDAKAPGSVVRQSLRGLIEERGAEIDLRPRLAIHTDDVQATHGATTGQLDEALLFYLLSRGLDRDSARVLLKRAFLGDALSAIDLPALRAEAELAAAGELK